ncbi:DnaB-like helicase C-terminal domain-containing protein, partial [Arthrospira platensis SPKY2]
SVGKSALAMTSMVVEAFKNNKDIAIDLFSLEMSKRSVINRILCNRLSLSYHTFLNPYKFLDSGQKQAVRNELDKIAQEYDLKIYTAGIKLDGILREIRTRARDAKQAGKKIG